MLNFQFRPRKISEYVPPMISLPPRAAIVERAQSVGVAPLVMAMDQLREVTLSEAFENVDGEGVVGHERGERGKVEGVGGGFAG